MAEHRLLIIIPAFNEQEALPGVLADLSAHHPLTDVLVVDDGSSDDTAHVARMCGARVAPLAMNLGIGGALRTGFRYALRHGYDRAVQFDADGQHIAQEISALTRELDQGSNLVIGSRFAGGPRDYDVSAARGGAMALLRLLIRALSGYAFSDTSSGFRAFDRAAIELFARRYPAEYMDSVEALVLGLNAGLTVTETPVEMRERAGGEPSNRSLRLVYHFLRVLTVVVASASLESRRSRVKVPS